MNMAPSSLSFPRVKFASQWVQPSVMDTHPQQLLAMATEFTLNPGSPESPKIKLCRGRDHETWGIFDSRGDVLNNRGKWEEQLQPSSRTPAFLKRCRFPTLDAALEAAQQFLGFNIDGNTNQQPES